MKEQNIKMSYSSDLIKDYFPELPLDSDKKFQVLGKNKENTPLVFSIGTDNQFYLTHQKDSTATGWEQINLSSSFKGYEVTTFECHSDDTNTYARIAMVLKKEGKTELCITDKIDTHTFNWSNLSKETKTFWKKQTIVDEQANVDQVLLDLEGAFIATSKDGEDAKYYRIEGNECKLHELPEHGKHIKDMKIGQVYGDRGMFLLYEFSNKSQRLLFQTFSDSKQTQDTYDFECNESINSVTLGVLDDNNTHALYAAGNGVFVFQDPSEEKKILLEPKEFDIQKIEFAQHENEASIWAHDKAKRELYHIMGYQGEEDIKWLPAIPMKQEVDSFSCLRGQYIKTQLFYTSKNTSINYFYQDGVSGKWNENYIPVQAIGKAKECKSYFGAIKFEQNLNDTIKSFVDMDFDTDVPAQIQTQTVEIYTASSMTMQINGITYHSTPGKPIGVPLNSMGELIVTQKVNDLIDSSFFVVHPGVKEPFFIDLSSGVYEKLGKLLSVDGILAAVRKNGEKLIKDQKIRENNEAIKGIVEAISHLLDFKKMCSKKSQSKTIANSMIDILFRDMKNLSQLLKVFSKVESLLKEIQKTQDIKKQIKKFEEIIDILVGELKKDDKAWEEHKHSIDGFNKIINGTQKFDELQSQCEVTNNLLSISDDKVSVQPGSSNINMTFNERGDFWLSRGKVIIVSGRIGSMAGFIVGALVALEGAKEGAEIGTVVGGGIIGALVGAAIGAAIGFLIYSLFGSDATSPNPKNTPPYIDITILEYGCDGANFSYYDKDSVKTIDWSGPDFSQHILGILQLILGQLGIDKESLFDWVTTEFDWKDVVNTKNVLSSFTKDSLNLLPDMFHFLTPEKKAEAFKFFGDKMKGGLDGDIDKIFGDKTLQDFMKQMQGEVDEVDKDGVLRKIIDKNLMHKWFASKMVYLLPLADFSEIEKKMESQKDFYDKVGKKFDEEINPLVDKMGEKVKGMGDDVIDIIKGKDGLAGGMKKIMGMVGGDAVDFMKGASDMIDKDMIDPQKIIDILDAKVKIPIFDEIFGGDMSLFDLIFIDVSILFNEFYKEKEGKFPFIDNGEKDKLFNIIKQVKDVLAGEVIPPDDGATGVLAKIQGSLIVIRVITFGLSRVGYSDKELRELAWKYWLYLLDLFLRGIIFLLGFIIFCLLYGKKDFLERLHKAELGIFITVLLLFIYNFFRTLCMCCSLPSENNTSGLEEFRKTFGRIRKCVASITFCVGIFNFFRYIVYVMEESRDFPWHMKFIWSFLFQILALGNLIAAYKGDKWGGFIVSSMRLIFLLWLGLWIIITQGPKSLPDSIFD